jgi:hypothetical protein
MRGAGLSRRLVAILFVAAGLLAIRRPVSPSPQTSSRIMSPVDDSSRILIPYSTPSLARAAYDRGPVDATLPMDHLVLMLKSSPAQEVQMRALLDSQQIESSPNYHLWLTPDQFGQMFGPSAEDIDQVRIWLAQEGFRVAPVPHGRRWLDFSGTAAQVESAFHTQMRRYGWTVCHIFRTQQTSPFPSPWHQ